MTDPQKPSWRGVILRGLRKRCPRCGKGPLFRRFIRLHTHCSSCGLALGDRPGDTWGFWVIGDRIFIIVPMVLLYFGFTPESQWARLLFLALVVIPLIATMPHRFGVCLAIDYMTRSLSRDEDDFPED